jgi:hypothetical protein
MPTSDSPFVSLRSAPLPLRVALSILLMFAFSQCGRTQQTSTPPTSAQKDSARGAAEVQAKVQRLAKVLDQIDATHARHNTAEEEEVDRLINACYAADRTLGTIVRAMDRNDLFSAEIREEDRRFVREDSTRLGKAGKTVNGVLGIYSCYGLMYRMRFGHDEAAMAELDRRETALKSKMRPKIPAIEALAAMSDGIFHMARAIVGSFAPDSMLAGGFEVIEQNYADGQKAAESDEDRFLNGVYRTFEVCQLWALLLDPSKREEISKLNQQMFAEGKSADTVERQMTISMLYFYKMHLLIARRLLTAAR